MLVAGPNLALDRVVRIGELKVGEVQRFLSAEVVAGGKGVNVCRAVQILGHRARLVGLVPGRTGRAVADMLEEEGVQLRPVSCPGEIRAATIVLEESGRVTVLNEPGPPLPEGTWAEYERAVGESFEEGGDLLVCIGQVPDGAPPTAYADLVRMARHRGHRSLVDAAGILLAEALAAQPDFVAPNLVEAEEVLGGTAGQPTRNEGEDFRGRAVAAARKLHELGARTAIIKAGEHGAAFHGVEGSGWVPAPVADVVNPIGAGDSFVAALVSDLDLGASLAEAMITAAAVAAASVEIDRPGVFDPARARAMAPSVLSGHHHTAPTVKLHFAKPLKVPPNPVMRPYQGGLAIAELRGQSLASGPTAPEDWIASTTPVFGAAPIGIGHLTDGRLFSDVIGADPATFLGPDHIARYGADPGLLVKLVDAGQRLPFHCHPDRGYAARHLEGRWGKTEAWIILSTRDDAAVGLGFKKDVPRSTLEDWVAIQDSSAMLGALNWYPVRPGEVFFVPGGVPHWVGEGIFLVAVQEASDLDLLLEWRGFVETQEEATMGLSWAVALDAVDLAARSIPAETPEHVREGVERLLGEHASTYFQAERIKPQGEVVLEPSFAVLVVTAGDGFLNGEPIRRGDTLIVPWAAGECVVSGGVELIRCLPPRT